MHINQLQKLFLSNYNLTENDTLFLPYGSRVYGTAKPDADYDFIAVVPNNSRIEDGTGYHLFHDDGDLNLQVESRDTFQRHLTEHKVKALECWYMPHEMMPKKSIMHVGANFKFKLDLRALRHEFSSKASNSFVKAKKKIEKEKDYYIGWKSLFHSLRILNFGIQIAKDGKIDFSAANEYWFDILNANQYDWTYFKNKYQPVYNGLATEFRKLAPKE